MGVESAARAIDNHYYKRQIDMFSGVDNIKFKELYDNRQNYPEILKLSTRTHVCSMITEFVMRVHENTSSSPFHFHPKIQVNTFPYNLSDEEISDLVLTMRDLTSGKADIEIVHLSPKQVSPYYVKNNLSMVIMYDYPKWLELHSVSGDIKKATSPDVIMIGPAIYFKPVKPSEANLVKLVEAMEQLAAPFIALKLVPVDIFSSVMRFKKKEDTPKTNTRTTT